LKYEVVVSGSIATMKGKHYVLIALILVALIAIAIVIWGSRQPAKSPVSIESQLWALGELEGYGYVVGEVMAKPEAQLSEFTVDRVKMDDTSKLEKVLRISPSADTSITSQISAKYGQENVSLFLASFNLSIQTEFCKNLDLSNISGSKEFWSRARSDSEGEASATFNEFMSLIKSDLRFPSDFKEGAVKDYIKTLEVLNSSVKAKIMGSRKN
jgi:hypothetical protein